MANTKSAKKEARKTVGRTLLNRGVKSRLKTLSKNVSAALDGDDTSVAKTAVTEAISAYDRAAKRKIIHANKARRFKSKASRALASKS
tara:strand:+ start:691 stop:954 length:264 start_codon:yes stop_codon:yes gene_type:complete